jgi:hypothetical protein
MRNLLQKWGYEWFFAWDFGWWSWMILIDSIKFHWHWQVLEIYVRCVIHQMCVCVCVCVCFVNHKNIMILFFFKKTILKWKKKHIWKGYYVFFPFNFCLWTWHGMKSMGVLASQDNSKLVCDIHIQPFKIMTIESKLKWLQIEVIVNYFISWPF